MESGKNVTGEFQAAISILLAAACVERRKSLGKDGGSVGRKLKLKGQKVSFIHDFEITSHL